MVVLRSVTLFAFLLLTQPNAGRVEGQIIDEMNNERLHYHLYS